MIQPINNKIQIEIEKPTAGGLDLSSKPGAVECGTVIATAKDLTEINKGDKILVKAWSIDIINYNDKTFYFVDADSEGICAVIRE